MQNINESPGHKVPSPLDFVLTVITIAIISGIVCSIGAAIDYENALRQHQVEKLRGGR